MTNDPLWPPLATVFHQKVETYGLLQKNLTDFLMSLQATFQKSQTNVCWQKQFHFINSAAVKGWFEIILDSNATRIENNSLPQNFWTGFLQVEKNQCYENILWIYLAFFFIPFKRRIFKGGGDLGTPTLMFYLLMLHTFGTWRCSGLWWQKLFFRVVCSIDVSKPENVIFQMCVNTCITKWITFSTVCTSMWWESFEFLKAPFHFLFCILTLNWVMYRIY